MSAPSQQPKLSLAVSESTEILYNFLLEIFGELDVDICEDGGVPDLDPANYQITQRGMNPEHATLLHAERKENEKLTKDLAKYFNTLSNVRVLESIGEASRRIHEATQEVAQAARRHQEILQVRAKTMDVFQIKDGEVAPRVGPQWPAFRTAANRDLREFNEAYEACVKKVTALEETVRLAQAELLKREEGRNQ